MTSILNVPVRWVSILLLTLVVGCGAKTPEEHVQAAKEAMAQDDTALASLELLNALAQDNQHLEARSMLGKLRLDEGDSETAIKHLMRAVNLGADDEATQIAYLRAKIQTGDHLAVIGELEGAANLTPDFYAVLGEAYITAGDTSAAKGVLQRSLQTPRGLAGMAQVAFLEGNAQRALSYVSQALELAPSDRNLWLLQGNIQLALEDAPAALTSFDQADAFPQARLQARLGLVRAHLLTNDLAEADKSVDRLIAVNKNYPYGHYLKGLVAYRLEDFAGAEIALKRAMVNIPDYPDAQRLMAIVKYELGQIQDSERLLRRFLEGDSQDLFARKMLARILSEKGQFVEVVELLQPIAGQRNDPQVWAMLGKALMQNGETGSATEAFENAVKIAPDTSVFRNQLALSLLSSGERQQAVDELTSALATDDNPLQSEYLLVLVKIQEKDFAAARDIVMQMLSRDETNPVGYYLQGMISLAEKDPTSAKTFFEAALEQDVSYFPAGQTLAQLAFQEGNRSEARTIYERMAEMDGGNERASQALVQLDISDGEFSQALSRLEQMKDQFPGSVAVREGLGRLLMALGRTGEAKATVEDALSVATDNENLLFLKAQIELRSGEPKAAQQTAARLQALALGVDKTEDFHASLGALQLRVGAFTAARQNLLRVLEQADPPSAEVLLNLVQIEVMEKNARSAQKYFAQLPPESLRMEKARLIHGDLLLLQEKRDEAVDQYRLAADEGSRNAAVKAALILSQAQDFAQVDAFLSDWLATHSADAGVQSLLAAAKVQLGDLAAAKAQYESMLPSQDPVVLNNLAWIYFVDGDRRALDTARRAHQLAPDNPDVQDTLGWILVQSDQLEEALALLQSSAKSRTNNGAVHYHLGVAYLRVGDQEKGVDALRKSIEFGGFDEIAEAQAELNRVL